MSLTATVLTNGGVETSDIAAVAELVDCNAGAANTAVAAVRYSAFMGTPEYLTADHSTDLLRSRLKR